MSMQSQQISYILRFNTTKKPMELLRTCFVARQALHRARGPWRLPPHPPSAACSAAKAALHRTVCVCVCVCVWAAV